MQVDVRQDDHCGVASDDSDYLPIPSDHSAVSRDEFSQKLDAANRPRRFRWSWFRVAAKRGGGENQRPLQALVRLRRPDDASNRQDALS